MTSRHAAIAVALTVVSAGACLQQSRTEVQGANTGTSVPRTPWGKPDLQGIWNSKVMAPLERPAKFAQREFLTDEEIAAIEGQADNVAGEGRDVRAKTGTPEDVEGAYNNIFSTGNGTKYMRSKRTSMIVDPPDGKLPPLTEEGKRLWAERPDNRFGEATESGDAPLVGVDGRRITYARSGGKGKTAGGQLLPGLDLEGRTNDNPEDRNNLERCRGVNLPCIGSLCGLTRLVQTPEYITWYYEAGHFGGAYRTIPLDGRPHLPPSTRLWLGDSVGRWEGDTLVIDTTNFTDDTAYRGVGDAQMHLVERLTRTSTDDLKYEITVEKPNMYARPWTMEVMLMREDDRKNQIFESACYEGNYAMPAMLAGARLEERESRRPRSGSR